MAIIKAGAYRFNDVLTEPTFNMDENVCFCIPHLYTIDLNTMEVSIIEGYLKFEYFFWDTQGLYYTTIGGSAPVYYTYEYKWNSTASNVSKMVDGIGNIEVLNGFGQTIVIPEDQEVSDNFATWFNANATLAELETIQIVLRSPNGKRLLTKGKLCDKDIDVIPNLQEITVTENGEIVPEDGFAGFSKVVVNVPVGSIEEIEEYNGSYELSGTMLEQENDYGTTVTIDSFTEESNEYGTTVVV